MGAQLRSVAKQKAWAFQGLLYFNNTFRQKHAKKTKKYITQPKTFLSVPPPPHPNKYKTLTSALIVLGYVGEMSTNSDGRLMSTNDDNDEKIFAMTDGFSSTLKFYLNGMCSLAITVAKVH